jgi:hypothetical protein
MHSGVAAFPLWFSKNNKNFIDPDSTTTRNANTGQYYNDDCFGLIFLSGALVEHDLVFSATFLVLSALAAVATNLGGSSASALSLLLLPGNSRRVPAIVAASTLLLRYLLFSSFMGGSRSMLISMDTDSSETITSAGLLPAVCLVSIVYGFVGNNNNNNNNNKDE